MLLERLGKKMIVSVISKYTIRVSSLLETHGLANRKDNRLVENPGRLVSQGYCPSPHKVIVLMTQDYYSCQLKRYFYECTKFPSVVKDKRKKYHFF
jgi:hypothetical protein